MINKIKSLLKRKFFNPSEKIILTEKKCPHCASRGVFIFNDDGKNRLNNKSIAPNGNKNMLLLIISLFLFSSLLIAQSNGFVTVKGKETVDPKGKSILLRGINLGNWLNPEGYMFRFENTSSFRLIDNTIKELVGADEARNFWQAFRNNYITKEDIHFIKSVGLNHVRVPFNFKLFLVEDHPEIWLDEGFNRLDDVIHWCKEEVGRRIRLMSERLLLSFSNHSLASPRAITSSKYRQWRVVTIDLP